MMAPHNLLHASMGPLAPPMEYQDGRLPYDWDHEHRFPMWVMQRPPVPRSQGSRTAVFADGKHHAVWRACIGSLHDSHGQCLKYNFNLQI